MTKSKRGRYTLEFKQEAARLVESGPSCNIRRLALCCRSFILQRSRSSSSVLSIRNSTSAAIRTIAQLMGHGTIQMSMRYAHLSPDHNQSAVDRLVEFGPEGTPKRTPGKRKI